MLKQFKKKITKLIIGYPWSDQKELKQCIEKVNAALLELKKQNKKPLHLAISFLLMFKIKPVLI